MFPNGLSVLTHLFILLLGFSKRLIEVVAEKMKWDMFNFKFNLYLGWKISGPLTNKAGDTLARRLFAFVIVLAVGVMVISTTVASVKLAFDKHSNIQLAKAFLNGGFAQAKEMVAPLLMKDPGFSVSAFFREASEPQQKYVYFLPLAEDIKK